MLGTLADSRGAIEFEGDDNKDEFPAADPGTTVIGDRSWGCQEEQVVLSIELHAEGLESGAAAAVGGAMAAVGSINEVPPSSAPVKSEKTG